MLLELTVKICKANHSILIVHKMDNSFHKNATVIRIGYFVQLFYGKKAKLSVICAINRAKNWIPASAGMTSLMQ